MSKIQERAVSVVASGLRYRLYIEQVRPPEVNYENKYINYSEQPSFHTFVYIISREIFSMLLSFFPNPKEVRKLPYRSFHSNLPTRTPVFCPVLRESKFSVDPRFELANVN